MVTRLRALEFLDAFVAGDRSNPGSNFRASVGVFVQECARQMEFGEVNYYYYYYSTTTTIIILLQVPPLVVVARCDLIRNVCLLFDIIARTVIWLCLKGSICRII